MREEKVINGGMGLISTLTLIFVVLKFVKVIDWSWFWVLSPIIFTVGFWAVLVLFFIIATLIIRTFDL